MMMMKDKDIEQVFKLFKPADEVHLTTIDYPRAAKKEDYPVWIQKNIIITLTGELLIKN